MQNHMHHKHSKTYLLNSNIPHCFVITAFLLLPHQIRSYHCLLFLSPKTPKLCHFPRPNRNSWFHVPPPSLPFFFPTAVFCSADKLSGQRHVQNVTEKVVLLPKAHTTTWALLLQAPACHILASVFFEFQLRQIRHKMSYFPVPNGQGQCHYSNFIQQ